MDELNQAVNALFTTTTPVSYGNRNHATGFFLVFDDEPYLVTNKHVVDFKTANGEDLSKARIIHRPNPDDVTEYTSIEIALRGEDNASLWYEHSDDTVDIAILPLEPPVTESQILVEPLANSNSGADEREYQSGSFGYPAHSGGRFDITIHETIIGGTSALTIGYPFKSGNRFPVARHSTISSPYGESFHGKPCFATDTRTDQGLSGSPIISVSQPDSYLYGHDDVSAEQAAKTSVHLDWNLLGIHSGQADISRDFELGIGWYAELLYEILPP